MGKLDEQPYARRLELHVLEWRLGKERLCVTPHVLMRVIGNRNVAQLEAVYGLVIGEFEPLRPDNPGPCAENRLERNITHLPDLLLQQRIQLGQKQFVDASAFHKL